MTVKLPENPREADYEDLVASCLLGLGFFIETSLTLREETTEVLELDVVATSAADPLNHSVLVDAKSGGGGGFKDVFKMFGWMTYLKMQRGLVIRSREIESGEVEAMARVAKRTKVEVLCFNPALDDASLLPDAPLPMPDAVRTKLITSAWWGRIGQRVCLKAFRSFVKSSAIVSAEAARAYKMALDNSFFARTPQMRARRLYSAYSAAPKMTRQVVDELADGDADKAEAIWNSARGASTRQPIQYCMMLESRARLGILKNALLHVLQHETEDESHGMARGPLVASVLPESFREGLTWLASHPARLSIPLLMQVFIEVFGGFYQQGKPEELDLLSTASGVPRDQVEVCLETFDKLFPLKTGWFFEKDGLRQMKAVPAIYRGTGAWLRKDLYDIENYDAYSRGMGWLLDKWHNAIHDILEPELGVDPGHKKAR
ncbi:MAG: hypothetical protein ABL998_04615 [Planctomycetota bacterium]